MNAGDGYRFFLGLRRIIPAAYFGGVFSGLVRDRGRPNVHYPMLTRKELGTAVVRMPYGDVAQRVRCWLTIQGGRLLLSGWDAVGIYSY